MEDPTTNVGGETDTSPYPAESGQKYISIMAYMRNMQRLIRHVPTKA